MTKDFAIALQFLLAAEIRKASIIIHSQIKVVASQELWSTLFTYIHSAVSCFNLPLSSMFLLCWLDLQRYGEHNAQDFGHRYFNGPSMPDPLLNAFFGVNYFQLLTQRYMEASTKQEPQCPAKGGRWGSNDLDDWDLHDWTPQSLSGSATWGTAKAPAWHLRKEAVTGSLASPHGFKWVKGSEEWVVESDIRYPYRSRSKTNVKKKILVAYSCQKRVEVCWIWQHKQEHAKIVSHDGLYIYICTYVRNTTRHKQMTKMWKTKTISGISISAQIKLLRRSQGSMDRKKKGKNLRKQGGLSQGGDIGNSQVRFEISFRFW